MSIPELREALSNIPKDHPLFKAVDVEDSAPTIIRGRAKFLSVALVATLQVVGLAALSMLDLAWNSRLAITDKKRWAKWNKTTRIENATRRNCIYRIALVAWQGVFKTEVVVVKVRLAQDQHVSRLFKHHLEKQLRAAIDKVDDDYDKRCVGVPANELVDHASFLQLATSRLEWAIKQIHSARYLPTVKDALLRRHYLRSFTKDEIQNFATLPVKKEEFHEKQYKYFREEFVNGINMEWQAKLIQIREDQLERLDPAKKAEILRQEAEETKREPNRNSLFGYFLSQVRVNEFFPAKYRDARGRLEANGGPNLEENLQSQLNKLTQAYEERFNLFKKLLEAHPDSAIPLSEYPAKPQRKAGR